MIKEIHHPEVGPVRISRRRGTRSIRLSVRGGRVVLSIPYGVREEQALRFLDSKTEWIQKHREESAVITDGDRIGRAHVIRIIPGDTPRVRTKVRHNELIVDIPTTEHFASPAVQQHVRRAILRILSKEAQSLLLQRLQQVSTQTGIAYRQAGIKATKSRWGSCSSLNDITLSTYLVQLPWPLIDYVIVHELCHTIHHNHSKEFWSKVATILPDYKERRSQLKSFQTDIQPNALSANV